MNSLHRSSKKSRSRFSQWQQNSSSRSRDSRETTIPATNPKPRYRKNFSDCLQLIDGYYTPKRWESKKSFRIWRQNSKNGKTIFQPIPTPFYFFFSSPKSVLLTSGIGKITSMSHDPFTNNLYACDEEKRTLDVWSLHTRNRKTLIKYSSGHRAVSVVVAADQRSVILLLLVDTNRGGGDL